MKRKFTKLLPFVCLILFSRSAFSQGVGINSTGAAANSSAMLDVTSTTQGMLIPRMTQTQRDAIASPATGLLIYQTDNTAGFYYYSGTAWTSLSSGSGTTLGQTATSVFGSGPLTLSSTGIFTLVPGLTTSINVPANYSLYIATDGGFKTNSTSSTEYSMVDIEVYIDAVSQANGGRQRIVAANTSYLQSISASWSLSFIVTPTPSTGTHTISVKAALENGFSATVGGDNTSLAQPELTVILIKN